MKRTSKNLSVMIGTLACLLAILVFITGKENLTESLNPKTPTSIPLLPEITQIPTLTEVGTPSVIPNVSEFPTNKPTALPALYTITQQEYTNEDWFGRNKFYGNAEDGQSFRIKEVSELQEIAIYLSYRSGGNNERPIRCSLMDSRYNILTETEIPGFQSENGWKTFHFQPGILLQPGTYIFSVFTQGSYLLRFTENPRAYSEGERYTRTWKDTGWESSEGDLSFSIFLTKEESTKTIAHKASTEPRQSGVISSRPPAGNASRWLPSSLLNKLLFVLAIFGH